jgi:hypothetical protein
MVSGMEGVGEAVTGGLLARTVEPAAGEQGGHEPGNCLNCGAALEGAYCHQCGQRGHVHRTLVAFWHDLAHGVLHFEGKIWRTLPMLAWRPGALTRRYIDGERARFVSPMALFLFSVFLMFATFSLIGGPFALGGVGMAGGGISPAEQRIAAEQRFHEQQAAARERLDGLRARRADRAAHGRDTAEIDARIREAEAAAQLQQRIFTQTMGLVAAEEQRLRSQRPTPAPPPAPAPAPPHVAGGDDADRVDVNVSEQPSRIEWVNQAWRSAKSNPELLAFRLQTNAYKFSWALIPISLPFLWLLFLHRRRYWRYKAFDHTVFVTYSIAFMSLGLIALSLLRPLGVGDTFMGLVIVLVPPVHIYRQLRGAYALSRFSALWRTAALLFFALMAATIFFLLLVLVGALE